MNVQSLAYKRRGCRPDRTIWHPHQLDGIPEQTLSAIELLPGDYTLIKLQRKGFPSPPVTLRGDPPEHLRLCGALRLQVSKAGDEVCSHANSRY
jgi:hypothetical protein